MLRALHKSKVPIWHTEGFNPHPFATFPLPLSLGFRGINECMDVKLEDDEFPFDEIVNRMNKCLPRGIRVFNVTEPVMKAGKIAYASFTMNIGDDRTSSNIVCSQIKELMSLDTIEIEKKSKKGMRLVDIKPAIKSYELTEHMDYAELKIVLSAGSTENVNPNLLITALNNQFGVEYSIDITRNDLYNSDMELFR
jgi:radical SAM-linked protein